VVDHVVGTDRPDQLELVRGVDRGHLGAVCSCELDREEPHATAGAVDESLLAGL